MPSAWLNPIHLSRLSLNVLPSLWLPIFVSPLGDFITISAFTVNQYLQLKVCLLSLSVDCGHQLCQSYLLLYLQGPGTEKVLRQKNCLWGQGP